MRSVLNVLIVEDHPMMVEAYKNILEIGYNNVVHFHTAFNCEKAFKIIKYDNIVYDLALIDIILPQYSEKNILSGEDLAMLLKHQMPECKLMLLTSLSETFKIYDILDKIKPNALLIKSDFTPNELLQYFQLVLEGEYCYSQTVQKGLSRLKKSALYLDSVNRQIINLLAKGILTKNIPSYTNLSLSAIDKRKSYIKTFFDIESGNDQDIITKAKELGLI